MRYAVGDAVKVLRDFEGEKRTTPEPGIVEQIEGNDIRVRFTRFNQSVTTVTEFDIEPDYPELNKVAKQIAKETLAVIGQNVQGVTSKMPYKAQYVLEEVIKILEGYV